MYTKKASNRYKLLSEQEVKRVLNDFVMGTSPLNDSLKSLGFNEKTLKTNNSLTNKLKYMGHINSWDNSEFTIPSGEVKLVEFRGFSPLAATSFKISSFVEIYKEISSEKFDKESNFQNKNHVDFLAKYGNSKKEVLKALTKVILTEVNIFRDLMFREDIYKNSRFSVTDKKGLINIRELKGLSEDAQEKVLEHYKEIAQRIGYLPAGESITLAANSTTHAMYITFTKSPDKSGEPQSITSTIYNAGNFSSYHQMAKDGKIYPHVVQNISIENRRDIEKLTNYLAGISIKLEYKVGKNNSLENIDSERLKHINDKAFSKHLYKSDLGGNLKSDFTENLSYRSQITGNCTVKNNQLNIKGMLKDNTTLYKHLKKREIKLVKDSLKTLYKEYKNSPLKKSSKQYKYKNLTSKDILKKFIKDYESLESFKKNKMFQIYINKYISTGEQKFYNATLQYVSKDKNRLFFANSNVVHNFKLNKPEEIQRAYRLLNFLNSNGLFKKSNITVNHKSLEDFNLIIHSHIAKKLQNIINRYITTGDANDYDKAIKYSKRYVSQISKLENKMSFSTYSSITEERA